MNPTSVDIKDLLEAEETLGLRFTENLFIGREPDKPSECITLYDTGGRPPMQTFTPGENYYYESFQVRVRDNDYERAFKNSLDILKALHGRAQETVNGSLYTVITCTSGPALLEWDDNNRVKFITNYLIQRREA